LDVSPRYIAGAAADAGIDSCRLDTISRDYVKCTRERLWGSRRATIQTLG